jgi:hypothetical protein
MLSYREFKVGDYVQFKGYPNIATGILSKPDLGKITEFYTPFDEERIRLELVNGNENIVCDYIHLWPIRLNPHVLELYGFRPNVNLATNRTNFVLNHLVLTMGSLLEPHNNTIIFLPYCIGDLTNLLDLRPFQDESGLNMELFHKTYPPVRDINDLLLLLNKNGIDATIDNYNEYRFKDKKNIDTDL